MRIDRLIACAALFALACTDPAAKKQATPEPQPEPQPVAGNSGSQSGTGAGAAADAAAYVEAQVALYKPLAIAASKTWYAASVSGSDADFTASKQADMAVDTFKSDTQRFAKLRALRERDDIKDPLVKRQIELMYLSMLGKQVEPTMLAKITEVEKQVEQLFNTYRGTVDGKQVSHNQIEDILEKSVDSKELLAAWEAQKGVGPKIAPKLLELVGLRNEVAKKLGFRDFYAMRLAEGELEEEKLLALFDELDRLTREPFLAAKAVVDGRLAKRLGVPADKLMPWHYQNPFFQDPPGVFDTGLDAVYKKQDTVALSQRYYDEMGLASGDIVKRSDLFEKEGKTPHAFAVDIDREGDIRVLCNVVPGFRWQVTMVHELGHAVYDKFVDGKLPWLLREATHPLTTEGIAMMFDYHMANPIWAESMGLIKAEARAAAMKEARAYQAFAELQFSRWTQVMLRFERAMYNDPSQDLDTLWWDLVERYQGLKRPTRKAPDYASKIHLVVAPVYYQNYMLGKLFAAQVHEAIAKHVGKPPGDTVYVGDPKVGKFIVDKVFGPGARYDWSELTRFATGSDLAPDAFARRFQ